MQISEVYLGLGQDAFAHLIRGISIGKLKTYQIYEGFKVRAHLTKVNTEGLRKAVPNSGSASPAATTISPRIWPRRSWFPTWI